MSNPSLTSPSASHTGALDWNGAWPFELLGESAVMAGVRQQIREAAVHRGRVLLIADRGFTAERIARRLHDLSGVPAPFVTVDCGEDDPATLERVLFGRQSGLAAAHGGTLYLARVTDMPTSAQARLARALRDGDVTLEGGRRLLLDFRVVASAGPGIDEEVEDGRFRPDLHRRLAATRIHVPPLRHRPEDIAPLAMHLVATSCSARNAPPRTFTHAALASLMALPWPGNIAELKDRIERLCTGPDTGPIRAEDVLAEVRSDRRTGVPAHPGTLRDARRHFEREYVAAVLSRHGWRIAEAAATLGIERANLYRKIRQLGLSRPAPGSAEDT